jgi:thiol-disulfide isomerase/thioredoxin
VRSAGRLAAVLAVALLAGCGGSPPPSKKAAPPPFADCAALTAPNVDNRLPDLTLPCFTGGQTVDIGQIKGPALVNLWASWCPPCREELPAFQRLADRLDGRVRVVGVVTQDTRNGARWLATDLGITFPALVDEDADLLSGVGRSALPVTLFVDSAGRIAYTYNSQPLDDAALARLVDKYLGVVVPA